MPWTFKRTGQNSQVRRTFACNDCELEFTVWQDREAEPPECPSCALIAARAVQAPALLTTKSQAVDIAQATMEELGYTDFNDNQRKGDVAYKPPTPIQSAERDQILQDQAELSGAMEVPQLSTTPQVGANGAPIPGALSQAQMGASFFGGQIGGGALPTQVSAALHAGATANAAISRADGSDPMALLHKKRPPIHFDVVASDTPRRRVSIK